MLQAGGAGAHAAHLRLRPLAGMPEKAVLFQIAKGDQNAPNPSSTVVIRAGGLAGTTTFYRHDLAFAQNPGWPTQLKDPHAFLNATLVGPGGPAATAIALAAQQQIADFLASDGETITDPDGPEGALFEVPIDGPLPESTYFIP